MRITIELEPSTLDIAPADMLLAVLFASFNKFSLAVHKSGLYSSVTESRGKLRNILGKIASPYKCTVSGSK